MTIIQTTDDIRTDLILDAIFERLGDRELLCPVAGDGEWALETLMGALPSVQSFQVAPWSETNPRVFPYAVLVCTTCGYSMFFNVISLGLAKFFDLEVSEETNL